MKPIVGWTAISAVLLETASRDLAAINGAFSLTSAEWSVICFAAGIAVGAVAAWKAHK